MPEEDAASLRSRIFHLLFVVAAVLDAAAVCVFIAICKSTEWHPSLLRFAHRVWLGFLSGQGSSGRGFVSALLVAVFTIVFTIAAVGLLRGRAAMKKHVWESAGIGLVVLVTLTLIVYGSQFAWEVAHVTYEDHQALKTDNQELSSQLVRQQRGITSDDPAYMGLVQILRQFASYGNAAHGKPCTIVFTSEPDSLRIAQAIAETSALVSNCRTFGPDGPEVPDLISNKKEGMVPGAIVVHSTRENHAAISFQRGLGNLLPTRYSYVPPKSPSLAMTDNFMWVQFGSGVGWRQ